MVEPMIKVRGLHKYFGPLHVIKGVDLDVMPSEVVVIIGPSGAGKSTFLRCLNKSVRRRAWSFSNSTSSHI